MNPGAGQPSGPVGGNGCGRGLLQGLVGEQPTPRVVELGCGPAPQLYRLHQNSGAVTELCSDGSDVTDQAGSGEAALGHLTQGLLPHLRPQICDV